MDGILLFNKPILWTSHDAVDFIRRKLSQKTVGHAGTLDPLATGLLVILLGKATKLSEELSRSDKEYAGTVTLGIRTDTQDLEGRFISVKNAEHVQKSHVETVFSEMKGICQQVPPAFSATKKKGKNLYRWAREGVMVKKEPRQITIERLSVTEFFFPEVHFTLNCSKGTYVRVLCDEIGERLGCGATLSSLLRIRSGEFFLAGALKKEDIQFLSLTEIEKRLVHRHEDLLRV